MIGKQLIYNVGYRSCYLCGYSHSPDRAFRKFRRIFGERCCEDCLRIIIGNKRNGSARSSRFISLYRIRCGNYIKIRRPDHPSADNAGFVYEHRIVMEDFISNELGFTIYIDNQFVVHHINEITTDNRIENLQVMHNREHSILHNRPGVFG